jgi:hypothetical protein
VVETVRKVYWDNEMTAGYSPGKEGTGSLMKRAFNACKQAITVSFKYKIIQSERQFTSKKVEL